MPTKSAIHAAVATARAVRAVIARPPYATPGHFYSPLTTEADISRALSWASAPAPAVDLAQARQLALAARLRPVLAQPLPGPRYVAANRMFGPADAAVYRAMLAELRPSRVLEVGSGFSTVVALDEAQASPGLSELEITCVEPYPDRLLGLAAGVVVHVHDVFWPFEYPAQWLRQRRDWTEAYLLHAFLAGNVGWEILFFPSWLWQCRPELVPPWLAAEQPGSIWIRKVS